jgi:hypothetical protein
MVEPRRERRRMMAGLMGSAALVALAGRPARAFMPVKSGVYDQMVDNACGVTAEHAQLRADAERRLAGVPDAAKILAAMRCPICGCPLLPGTP